MSVGNWFAVANTVLCLGAALSYCFGKQWNSAVYWAGAVILNVAVLWRSV